MTVPGAAAFARCRGDRQDDARRRLEAKRETGDVSACVFSPDGARVVLAGYGNALKLWDIDTDRGTRSLDGHRDPVTAVEFSPDAARLVSASWDRTLKLWSAETGEEIQTMEGHASGVVDCGFSPDGARVVSGGHDKTLRLWDAETGECLVTLQLPGSPIDFAHHPNRPSVACADAAGSVYFCDLVGITLGPLVVTAVDIGRGPAVRCPVCFERYPVANDWLGQEVACAVHGCSGRMKLNSFVVNARPVRGGSVRRWAR